MQRALKLDFDKDDLGLVPLLTNEARSVILAKAQNACENRSGVV